MAIDNLEGGVAPVRPVVSRHGSRTEPASAAWLSFHDAQQTHLGSVHRFYLVALGSLSAAAPATRHALAAAGAAFAVDRPPPAAVSGWLLRIACRMLGEETSGRRRPERRGSAAVAEMGPGVAAALAVAAQLPERERLAVALRCGAGLGYPEIGGILGITEEAARMACRWAAWSIRDRTEKAAR
jgi:RNA polymerase sigma-70 factor, ECF subfamily